MTGDWTPDQPAQPAAPEHPLVPIDAARSGAGDTEDEWWLVLLTATLSSVVGIAAAVHRQVERSLGMPAEPSSDRVASDAAIGLIVGGTAIAATTTRAVMRPMRPVAATMMRPPLVPDWLQPQTWLESLARVGRGLRMHAAPVSAEMPAGAVDAMLDRIDLTDIVLERVALGPIVDRVLTDLDLAALAQQVIDEIDLPEIIRESTGAMRSEAMIGVRLQGIEADKRVGEIVDKILLRRVARKTRLQMPGQDGDATAE